MMKRAFLIFIGLFIFAAVVGGAVYWEWPVRSLRETRFQPTSSTGGTFSNPTISMDRNTTTSIQSFLPRFELAGAESAEGVASASPLLIPVGKPTEVTFTIQIADSRVIPQSVNLQRLDVTGRVLSVVGILNDIGANGDAVAGDKMFTIRQTIKETSPMLIHLRVSWALKGELKRSRSNTIILDVGQRISEPIPGVSFTVPSDWRGQFNDSLIYLLSPETRAKTVVSGAAHVEPDVYIERLANPESLPVREFALEFADGLFAMYRQQEQTLVAGREAIRFSNIGDIIDRAPVIAVFVGLPAGGVLLVALPVYERDLTQQRTDAFNAVVQSLSVN